MGRVKISDLTKYEVDFLKLCKDNNLKVKVDEDGCPIVRHNSKRFARFIYLCPWAKEMFAVIITAIDGKRIKDSIKRKLAKKNLDFIIHLDGESEGVFLFHTNLLKKVAKIIKCGVKKKANPNGIKALVAYRESKRLAGQGGV